METEFKEKTYEKYFSYEIARLTNTCYSPDQCDENFLGFDDAFFLPIPHLLLIAPYIRRSRRLRLSGVALHELDLLTERVVERMPPFRFNLFVQYKRPVYLRTRGAREWSFWHEPYYRFDVTPHQQGLLERIEAASHGRAATVYASPAFWRASDLWGFVKAEQIIDNSNVASAGSLAGQGCYTYKASGNLGIGHSEPRQIESQALREIVSVGVERNEETSAKDHIIKTAAIVREAADGDDITATLLAGASYPSVSDLEGSSRIREPRRSRLIEALETLTAFSDAFGISNYMHGSASD